MSSKINNECESRISKIEQAIFEKRGLLDKCAEVDEAVEKLEGKYNFAIGGVSMFNVLLGLGLVVWQILKK